MKLLLTSDGFENPNIGKKFLELIGKPASEIKVIFIPTAASRTPEELKYTEFARNEIIITGVSSKNIKTLDLDHRIAYSEVKDYDAIYVCGGNTFYLLKKVRESGFDKIVKEFVDEGKLYVGVSAGSILVCPSIEISAPFDPNDVGLKDYTGLSLVNFVIAPHSGKKDEAIINEYRKKLPYEISPLNDGQALLALDKKIVVIE